MFIFNIPMFYNFNMLCLSTINLNFIIDTYILPLFYFVLYCVLQLICILICIAFFVVGERKLLAAVQRRVGPNVVGFWGLLQAVADGLKLIVKEILIVSKANLLLYLFAPLNALFLSLFSWGFIPLSTDSVFLVDQYSVLIILAISSLNVYNIVLAGWASNSKYALFGALRSAAQMISYEVSISVCVLPVFLLSMSFDFWEIGCAQQSFWFWSFCLPAAIIFFISTIAETNRAPFDLPEAEGELVAGFNLEYSSIVFALFFLAEYGNILLMCSVTSIFFFGAWNAPSSFLDFIPTGIWMPLKITIFAVLFILIRGVLPRYRYDQLMFIGWQIFLPVSFFFLYLLCAFLFWTNSFRINEFAVLTTFNFQNLWLHLLSL